MAEAETRNVVRLGSRAWYGDHLVDLDLPPTWQVEVLWPATPPELTDDQILEQLRRPVGQAPLRDLAAGRTRPVILVDDLTRPTPASRVMPFVLAELEAAGIQSEAVTIVMATGTHGAPRPDAFEKKVGPQATARCRLHIHNHFGDVVARGRTSFGTPVLVNAEVAAADYVIGIGGLYPQHTTWYGGGSKLVLGVLGEKSIANLHYRHWHLDGKYALSNDFRRDLDEVASLVGLRTSITLHVNAQRQPVRMASGDQRAYYPDEARWSKAAYLARLPDGADVVISNAYPMDLSLTFAESKGQNPLKHAPAGASRVLLADCSEGDGHHGLFPLVHVPPRYYQIQRLRRQWLARSDLPAKVRQKVKYKIGAKLHPSPPATETAPVRRQVVMFRPHPEGEKVENGAAGVSVAPTWREVVARVTHEQGGRADLRAVVYPCAPLHTLAFRNAEPVAEPETE